MRGLTGLAVFTDSASTLDVTIEDLSATVGIDANFEMGSGHSLSIRHVEVGKGSPDADGIGVNATVAASVTIENSFVRTLEEPGRRHHHRNDPGRHLRYPHRRQPDHPARRQ